MRNHSPTNKSVFNLAWPIASNAVLLQCILIIDTILVTPLGEESLAAMGLAGSIGGIILGFLFAFSNGSQLLIAQAFGAENPIALKSSFWSGQVINWLASLAGISIIIFLGDVILGAIATTESMASQAKDYLLIFTGVIVGVSISHNITVLFNGTGNSKLPFYSNLIELPVNAGLSYVLIYGLWGIPEMGLSGAAWGSVVAVGLRTVFLVCCLYLTKQTFILLSGWMKGTFIQSLKHHFNQSYHIAITFISMSMTAHVCMMIYAKLGVNQFAALILILPWIRVAGNIVTAWAQATGILVGQLLGKNRWELLDGFVKQSWRFSVFISLFIAALYAGMFFLFEALYPGLEQETIDALWSLMPIVVALPFIRTSNTICGHVLRAGGEAPHVLKIHGFTQWLLTVPLTALFVLYLDLSVVWILGIIFLEEIVKSIPFHIRMLSGVWKRSLVNQ
jgi:putative MATE family efflux protein